MRAGLSIVVLIATAASALPILPPKSDFHEHSATEADNLQYTSEWAKAGADYSVNRAKEEYHDGNVKDAAHILGIAGTQYARWLYDGTRRIPYALRESISGY